MHIAPTTPSTQLDARPTSASDRGRGGGTSARVIMGGIAGSIADGIASLWPWGKPDLAPTDAVRGVDLTRYAGTWHEIARLPVRFQDPRSVSTAEYTPNADGTIGVRNTAYLGDDVSAQIRGTTTPVSGADGARLRVKFGGPLKWLPVSSAGNYWVLDLATDYSMALVGTPNRRNLWLLARDPNAYATAQASTMIEHARKLGFDTSRLRVADWERRRMHPTA